MADIRIHVDIQIGLSKCHLRQADGHLYEAGAAGVVSLYVRVFV